HEIRGSYLFVEVKQTIRQFSFLVQVFQEYCVGRKVVFNRSLSPSNYDIEASDTCVVELLENGLNEGFELEGVVIIAGDYGKHLFGYLFREGEQSSSYSARGNHRLVLTEVWRWTRSSHGQRTPQIMW